VLAVHTQSLVGWNIDTAAFEFVDIVAPVVVRTGSSLVEECLWAVAHSRVELVDSHKYCLLEVEVVRVVGTHQLALLETG